MELKDHIDASFQKYIESNTKELELFKNSLKDMIISLETKVNNVLSEFRESFTNDYEPKSFQDIVDYHRKMILEPLKHKTISYDLFLQANWSSFINPYGVDPLHDFEEFYHVVVTFVFLQDLFSTNPLSKKDLIKELKNFYFHWLVFNTIKYSYLNTEYFSGIIKKYKVSDPDIFIGTGIAIIQDYFDQSDVEINKILIHSLNFESIRDSFINDSFGRNINFTEPNEAFKWFYNELASEDLISMNYADFKTTLAIDRNKWISFNHTYKITISAEDTIMTVAQIGGIFYDFKIKYFKGSPKSFRIWVQSNFIWYTDKGKKVSMTNSNLNKYLKKFTPLKEI